MLTSPEFIIQCHSSQALSRVDAQNSAGPDGIPKHVVRACTDQLANKFSTGPGYCLQHGNVNTTTIKLPVPKHSSAKWLLPCCAHFQCYEILWETGSTSPYLPPTLDLNQFAYKPSYRGCHFSSFSSHPPAFNTIVPTEFVSKLNDLGIFNSICRWIMNPEEDTGRFAPEPVGLGPVYIILNTVVHTMHIMHIYCTDIYTYTPTICHILIYLLYMYLHIYQHLLFFKILFFTLLAL